MSSGSTNEYEVHEWESLKGPFNASYGKVMMWYFLISDTFVFGAFLVAYAAARTSNAESWPMASEVFSTVPGLSGNHYPLVFVSFMTFVLIISSVTMVRAVQEGFMGNRNGVIKYLIPTIAMGLLFLGCQYLEWSHLIHEGMTMWYTPFSALGHGHEGPQQFGMFFFTITGFHGMHVVTGVLLNIWLLVETAKGRFDKLGNYGMVEKVGLFWHFVDLVWVYVFLGYYLL
ncbi:MAG: cytochrome c oxidase subunit 3 [Chitinophagales bacterium]|tara:strand:+ start:321 stop:1007 length:687 start_codon:yes stop_codon:yes gene_type:complete